MTAATPKTQSTATRPLRRTERQLSREQTLEVIDASEHAVLCTCDLDANPYGAPISPVRDGNRLYFHGTKEPGGRKTDNMTMNPKVSVTFIAKAITLPEWYSVDFPSAVVRGKAALVTDPKEARRAMALLLEKFAPDNSAERNHVQGRVRGPLAAVWRIDIEAISGKARAAQDWKSWHTVKARQDIAPSPWLIGVPL